jgi:hypothetical protein
MFQHAFSTLLYVMIGSVLMQAIIVAFWGIRALRFRQPDVITDNLESTIRGWLDGSGLSAKPVSDPTWNFGLLTTLPNGESIYVIQKKESPRFIAFQSSLAISPEHQAILKAMPIPHFEKLMQGVVLNVFLTKMALTIRTRLSDVSFSSQLAITTSPMEDEFLEHLDDMDNAIIVAHDAISLAVERAAAEGYWNGRAPLRTLDISAPIVGQRANTRVARGESRVGKYHKHRPS